jgi:hypothetical protein
MSWSALPTADPRPEREFNGATAQPGCTRNDKGVGSSYRDFPHFSDIAEPEPMSAFAIISIRTSPAPVKRIADCHTHRSFSQFAQIALRTSGAAGSSASSFLRPSSVMAEDHKAGNPARVFTRVEEVG